MNEERVSLKIDVETDRSLITLNSPAIHFPTTIKSHSLPLARGKDTGVHLNNAVRACLIVAGLSPKPIMFPTETIITVLLTTNTQRENDIIRQHISVDFPHAMQTSVSILKQHSRRSPLMYNKAACTSHPTE